MKTLARQCDKAEILKRMKEVRPESVRRWGRMSAHQMICHLNDSFLIAIGEKFASDASGPLQRSVVKWIALYAPLRWPAGIQTRPEVDQELGGTLPVNFPSDVARLEDLVERITAPRRSFVWQPRHPLFGRMSETDWLRWAYLHTDHHFRQSGA